MAAMFYSPPKVTPLTWPYRANQWGIKCKSSKDGMPHKMGFNNIKIEMKNK